MDSDRIPDHEKLCQSEVNLKILRRAKHYSLQDPKQSSSKQPPNRVLVNRGNTSKAIK